MVDETSSQCRHVVVRFDSRSEERCADVVPVDVISARLAEPIARPRRVDSAGDQGWAE